MSSDEAQPGSDELQFDRVETAGSSTSTGAGPVVTCSVCSKTVGAYYFHANEKPVCSTCKNQLVSAAATPRSVGPLLRAGIFGVGAAVTGAAIYYAVIAITNFEIGLVAILIGYMVGFMVRKGARDRGGRRYQVLAIILTYWAVGLAYTPLAFKEFSNNEKSEAMLADSANVAAMSDSIVTIDSTAIDSVAAAFAQTLAAGDSSAAPDSATVDSLVNAFADGSNEPMTGQKFLLGLGLLFVFVFALPVMYVIGSLPGGLLSALIIAIGLRQAWSMTGRPNLAISGPYRVGTNPMPATG